MQRQRFEPLAAQSHAELLFVSMCVPEPLPASPMYSHFMSVAELPSTTCRLSLSGERSKMPGTVKSSCSAAAPPRT